ncbi:hypothetical protein [Nocardiopsis sp. MG754419]|uniref:hypothetical protein n=1 Tax=Nocardiopsis sp. MG754419 TaxID=2259865 RepID=UPI001BA4C514|nr:hypothetical protein [Nocardiopsis sp. MG754419]MBR8743999.1 hypothetical protein [Nocardiopsis sp. MG754419]
MMSAQPVPTSALRPLGDPAALVGQWVRVYDDGTVGLLLAADDTSWSLRTPVGERSGFGRLVAEPVTTRSQAGPVRRRLRAMMDDPGFPASEDLDLLDLQLAAHP